MLYPLLRPLLFRLDPERAHGLAIAALKWTPALRGKSAMPHLATKFAGLHFPNPLGMAAGFDKEGSASKALLGLNFGFVEVGTITPRPQPGNPKPRMFRLTADEGVINRLGFNSSGAEAALQNLLGRDRSAGIVGINIGANKDSGDRVADYAKMASIMAPHADYLTLNISSPNTPGLRDLQGEGKLAALIDAVLDSRGAARVPVFLKVAPDLTTSEIDDICRVVMDRRIDALMIGNTTVSRPDGLKSQHASETGGLSGRPLTLLARQKLKDFRSASGGALPLISIGGITTGQDAWENIKAGASLIQLYSAMTYRGPGIARAVLTELTSAMARDGFTSLSDAITHFHGRVADQRRT
jgi:dihydroorotate dehydrogenase